MFTIINFFIDGESKGVICYSKVWLEFIANLPNDYKESLELYFALISARAQYKYNRKVYNDKKSGTPFRYMNLSSPSGANILLKVPDFPGFSNFEIQLLTKEIHLSLKELNEYANAIKKADESDDLNPDLNDNTKIQ